MALKLWSKLEDAGDVTAPQQGSGGAEVGSPTYIAAKFNNGILSDIDSEGCTFPTAGNSINLDKGTIEFWAKLNFATTHGDNHYFLDFTSVNGGLAVGFVKALDDFFVSVIQGGVPRIDVYTTGVTWNVGDLVHFGLTWDREGNDIGGGKTVALYINDVLEVSSTITWDTDTVNANLYVGTDRNGSLHSDAVIDNIKTHDVCKIDFSDKEDESAGANQAPTAPTTLKVDSQASPTGANCVTATPQFVATYNDPDAADTSNAIDIQVGSASGLSDLWDSGWVAEAVAQGSECSAQTYGGTALSAGTSYWWRCRFRDDDDEEGAWSDWQQFDVCAAAVVAGARGGLLSQIW